MDTHLDGHHDADEEAPALGANRHHHAHQQEIVEPEHFVIVSGQIVADAGVQCGGEHLWNVAANLRT